MINRPEKHEIAPYYLSYVNLVPEGDIFEILSRQMEDIQLLFKNISEEQGEFRYGEGKWSLKEVLGHMVDTERIMSYRVLCISRGEKTSLPGFDQDMYVANASFNQESVEQLLEQFSAVRQSTMLLLKSLGPESLTRKGLANNAEVTPAALAYIIAGHAMHHCQIIKERYIETNH